MLKLPRVRRDLGLRNARNTCFALATMQAILRLPGFQHVRIQPKASVESSIYNDIHLYQQLQAITAADTVGHICSKTENITNAIAVATRRCCTSLVENPTDQQVADADMERLFRT